MRLRSRELIFSRRSVSSSPVLPCSLNAADEVRRRRRLDAAVAAAVAEDDEDEEAKGTSAVDVVGEVYGKRVGRNKPLDFIDG